MTIVTEPPKTASSPAGSPFEVLVGLSQAWPHLLRWPDCAFGLFPRGIRRPPPLARRTSLCRSRRLMPVPSRSGEQSGRLFHRPDARWFPRRACGLDRLYPAFGHRAGPLRLWCGRAERPRSVSGCFMASSLSPWLSLPKRFGAWRALCVPTGSELPSP